MSLVVDLHLHQPRGGGVPHSLGQLRIENVGGTVAVGRYRIEHQRPDGRLVVKILTRFERRRSPWELVHEALDLVTKEGT